MNQNTANSSLPKARSGIKGLDEITEGGLPKGRPTLICGSAGSGKTLFSMEFLVHGATDYAVLHDHAITRKDREIERKKKVLEAKIASLREEFDSVREELNKAYIEEELRKDFIKKNRKDMTESRDSKGKG